MHLYIHIPFCSKACHYCDFHFSTNITLKNDMVDAICKELELQKNYLIQKEISTIYFGGGTPSVLSAFDFDKIFNKINLIFSLKQKAEITVEANPEDINPTKINEFKTLGINRLSIGIQTFNDEKLKWMNRIHDASQAENCVKYCQDGGISNLSIDLIYGIPSQNHAIWRSDLFKAFELSVSHISAYCLTIEPKTVFGKWQKTNKLSKIEDEFAAQQFEILLSEIEKNGFEQYEISNFCKNENYSQHNSSYWQHEEYLGVGPSAHSFNLTSRQYNVPNNAKYIKSLAENKVPFSIEILTKNEIANDYLLTSLRTKWGTNLAKLNSIVNNWQKKNQHILAEYADLQMIRIENDNFYLTQKGKLLADKISSDLMIV